MYNETLDEAQDSASADGCAKVLVDITKCFDRLTMFQVWYWGMRAGLPRRFLRLVMGIFCFVRTVIVDGCCSDQVRIACALVAGSRFSVALLHVAIC